MVGSIFWRTEMEKVAVLPVPDWAWAMTSWPVRCQSLVPFKMEISFRLTLDDRHDSTLLDSRRALETVGIDTLEALAGAHIATDHCLSDRELTAEQLSLEVHLIERVDGLIVVRLDLSCGAKNCQRPCPMSVCVMRCAGKSSGDRSGQRRKCASVGRRRNAILAREKK